MGASIVAPVLLLLSAASLTIASIGDKDPKFQDYVELCAESGCLHFDCINGCSPLMEQVKAATFNASLARVTSPLALVLTAWDCLSECKYQSMLRREKERAAEPVKYYGKWPFYRILGLQEPASVLFSVLNLCATLWGLSSLTSLVYNKLPRKPMGDKGPLYEYTGLFVLYGLVQANSWFWSMVFHSRDVYITERLDYYSAICLIGYSLMLAITRTASLRAEAARVMVAAPIIAFTSSHICFLQFYPSPSFQYGWNITVCSVMGVIQLLLWIIWATVVRHPARVQVWLACFGTGLAMLLELYDFPPVAGVLDAHSLWHAATVPLTAIWWSFVLEDAKFRTNVILSKSSKKEVKKTN